MALENYLLEQIVYEAAPLVNNQLVGKIFEPKPLEFVINLRRSDSVSLLISLLPSRPAIFLTRKSPKHFSTDHSACHLTNMMRKYLSGATLTELVKETNERRIIINFSNFDTSGKLLKFSLLLDLMGRSANAHLFVDEVFLASLRELPENSPAISLSPFTTNKTSISLTEITSENLSQLLENSSLTEVANQIKEFSPTLVREFIARSENMPPLQALQSLAYDLSHPKSARIYALAPLSNLALGTINPRKNLILTYLDLEIAKDLVPTKFSSLNEATESYFDLSVRLEAFQASYNKLKAKLKAEILKLETLIKNLSKEKQEFSQADGQRRLGELILANLGTLRHEGEKLFLTDYFDVEQKEITLSITNNQTPQQLAEHYFKQYQRAKRGLQEVEKRLIKTEKELSTKQLLLSKLLSAVTEADLNLLEKPFAAPQITKQSNVKKDTVVSTSIRRYVSCDGYEILVGRSDKSNEELTFQMARPMDIWLHAADYPGPHVLIRNPQRGVIPQKTIYEAAQLAAFFSKARGETVAAVRYTERKNVTRPKKAKPGMALLTDFKTIMVPPQEAGSRLM